MGHTGIDWTIGDKKRRLVKKLSGNAKLQKALALAAISYSEAPETVTVNSPELVLA